jgi:hypothetical protein
VYVMHVCNFFRDLRVTRTAIRLEPICDDLIRDCVTFITSTR